MAKIERITKSRKENVCSKCRNVIPVGSTYLKATPFHQAPIIRCTTCGLKAYETSGSAYIQSVGAIVEDWRENYGINDGTAEAIASDLQDIYDSQEESLENMPESLQDGSVGTLLQERMECLESAIGELSDIVWEDCKSDAQSEVDSDMGESYNPEDSEYDSEKTFNREKETQVLSTTEELLSDMIDTALENIEY